MHPVQSNACECLRFFIEHRRVQGVIIALILINAVLLGLETWPAAMTVAGGLIPAIIVNAMQTFSEKEPQETVAAVEHAPGYIENDLHGKVRAMRKKIRELKFLLTQKPATNEK